MQKGRKWKINSPFHKCKPLDQEPLVVSGYGYTQYEINFCKECGRAIGKITKDHENLYSVEEL